MTDNEKLKNIADSMGIALYQRFDLNEASLFLRCNMADLRGLVKQAKINYLQVAKNEPTFFGHQLLEYLLQSSTNHKVRTEMPDNMPDRIIRAREVETMTGLSRTTIWRLENKMEFPRRISLGGNMIGWKLNDIQSWINDR